MKHSFSFLFFLASVLLLCSLSCKPVMPLNAVARRLVDSLQKDTDFYNTEHDEFSLTPLPQCTASLQLARMCTLAELQQLSTDHESPVVRMIAFRALLEQNAHEAVRLTLQNIRDTTQVWVSQYCDYFRDNLSNQRLFLIFGKQLQRKILPRDTLAVDSVLFCTPGLKHMNLQVDRVVSRKPTTEANYQRFRALAKDDHSKDALVKLAAYRRLQDTTIIKQALSCCCPVKNQKKFAVDDILLTDYALLAVEVWPHKAFVPELKLLGESFLLSYHGNDIWLSRLFICLRKYHAPWADALMWQSVLKAKPLLHSKDSDICLWAREILAAYKASKKYGYRER